MFNDTINDLGFIEIPLRDRAYTWSNKRERPTLVHLDRVFVNMAWSALFPSILLSSLMSIVSDHTSLLLFVSTTDPRSQYFRFDRSRALHQELRDSTPYLVQLLPLRPS